MLLLEYSFQNINHWCLKHKEYSFSGKHREGQIQPKRVKEEGMKVEELVKVKRLLRQTREQLSLVMV